MVDRARVVVTLDGGDAITTKMAGRDAGRHYTIVGVGLRAHPFGSMRESGNSPAFRW